MSDNYLDVIYKIIDDLFNDSDLEVIRDYKNMARTLLNAEKEYEFNEERPRIKTLLDSLIR